MEQTSTKKDRFPIFRQRLGELMFDMTTTEFAEKVGLTRQTMGFYLNGDRIPDAVTLAQICRKCNVSADWLIGLTNDPAPKPCAADELGLSPSIIAAIERMNQEAMNERKEISDFSEFAFSENHQYSAEASRKGLNLFLENTVDSCIFEAIYDLYRAVNDEQNNHIQSQKVISAISGDGCVYSGLSRDRDVEDIEICSKLEDELRKKYPVLAYKFQVKYGGLLLENKIEEICTCFRRRLEQFVGYNDYLKNVRNTGGKNAND